MSESPGAVLEKPGLEEVELPCPEPRLLVEPEPMFGSFRQNFRDLLSPPQLPPLQLKSSPSAFWPDVFVEQKLPWRRFSESGGYHLAALAILLGVTRFVAVQPRVVPQSAFNRNDVVYYAASEYLPPLDTRRTHPGRARPADPGLSPQPIISLPPEADNRSQTIVAAPRVKLQRDIQLPNSVSWSEKAATPIAPAPMVLASEITRLAPRIRMDRSVVPPPPDLTATASQKMQAPQTAVVAPPPSMDASYNRRLGDLNIARSTVIAPAPQLALDEQRAAPNGRATALRANSSQVIAPPPSLGTGQHPRSAGGRGAIALSLNPAVGAPPAAPPGNRRGDFSTAPNGHRGASGAAASSGMADSANGADAGNSKSHLPSGLYVGKVSAPTSSTAGTGNASANSVNPNLLASTRPPRLTSSSGSDKSKLTEAERGVFGSRKVYSLSLNMPNLNSAGGSWIIRFADLKPDFVPGRPEVAAELSSPVATRQVDPAYPLELMRQNVAGTVILFGVIHADGTVSSVRVLRSVDDRLDRFASDAIAKWKFQPATKNGAAVDVEATFWIPFRPSRTSF